MIPNFEIVCGNKLYASDESCMSVLDLNPILAESLSLLLLPETCSFSLLLSLNDDGDADSIFCIRKYSEFSKRFSFFFLSPCAFINVLMT